MKTFILVCLVLFTTSTAQALITFVDAWTDNTTLDGAELVEGVNYTTSGGQGSGTDGLWHFRTRATNGGGIWSSDTGCNEYTEPLVTTFTIATPGTYDIYGLFWNNANGTGNFDCAFSIGSDGPYTNYNKNNATAASASDFEGIVIVTDEGSCRMFKAVIGQITTTTANESVSVYVQGEPGLGGDERTWYDGVGYQTFESPFASNPNPGDWQTGVANDVVLSWLPGIYAASHDVYFGTDFDDVNDAGISTPDIYRGRQDVNSYTVPETLQEDTIYYWRIDEVNDANVWRGCLWSFRTAQSSRDIKSDTWAATDALGRELPGYEECGPPRPDKYVGIFYFLWLRWEHPSFGPFDITKLLAEDPCDPNWGPVHYPHHWGESEMGYYLSDDDYVIRKHTQMLSDAGIDTLIFDVTNAETYHGVYLKLCSIFRQIRKNEGGATPQICFLTHKNSVETVQTLYDDFYSQNLYPELWFRWQGKPLMLGDLTGHSAEVQNFFTFRYSWAWNAGYHKWQWLDIYPQDYGYDVPGVPEEVPVCIAEQETYMSLPTAHGRHYHNGTQPPEEQWTGEGCHFAEQWGRALELDPNFIFITGWNEWVAGRYLGDGGLVPEGETYFVDEYTQEFSRDVEPMKDGHTDNYYYQMIDNIRQFKGVRAPESASGAKTIVIDGYFSEWDTVCPEYKDDIGDTFHRNYAGFASAGPYVNSTGRNDFMDMKVARDDNYVYFYAQTRDDITSYTDPNWMLLFIDSDQNHSTGGWEGYDYIVNDTVNNSTSTTLKTTGWEPAGLVSYWKLDETGGQTAYDSAGDNDGSVYGNPVWVQGKVDGALSFDGDGDYVAANGISADIAGGDFTLLAWVKAGSTSSTRLIAAFNTSGGNNILFIGQYAGSINLQVYDVTSGWHDTGAVVFDDAWHYIGYVLDDSNNEVTVYVDGNDVYSYSTSTSIASTDLFSLGQEYDGASPSNFFNGLIDDVRIYNRALLPAEIITLKEGNSTVVNNDISYNVSGNKLELRVPRSDIGQVGDEVAFDFHWADNIQHPNDIIEFAVSGDSAPNRRFNYRYDTLVSTKACQRLFDDGQGNNMDLDTDCDIDIDDLALFAVNWLNSYDLVDFADLADDWLDEYLPDSLEAIILLDDNFEGGLDNWTTDWDLVTSNSFSPTHSIECSSSDNDLVSKDIDTSDKSSIRVSFKYKIDDVDNDDNVYVQYYNGSGYNNIFEIGTAEEDVWLYYSDVIYNAGVDTQYFVSNFRIKIEGSSINSGEHLWVDDVFINTIE